MRFLKRIIGKFISVFIMGVSSVLVKRGRILMMHWITDGKVEDERYHISTGQFKLLLNWLKAKNKVDYWKGLYQILNIVQINFVIFFRKCTYNYMYII